MYGWEQTHGGINDALTSNVEVLSIQTPKHADFTAKWQQRAVPTQWPALLTETAVPCAVIRSQNSAEDPAQHLIPTSSNIYFPLCFGGCSSHCFVLIRSLDQSALWLSHCSPPPAPWQRCAADSLVSQLHKCAPKISSSSIQDYADQKTFSSCRASN